MNRTSRTRTRIKTKTGINITSRSRIKPTKPISVRSSLNKRGTLDMIKRKRRSRTEEVTTQKILTYFSIVGKAVVGIVAVRVIGGMVVSTLSNVVNGVINGVINDSLPLHEINAKFLIACDDGDFLGVEQGLQKGAFDINRGLYLACVKNYFKIAKYLVANNNSLNCLDVGLLGASTGGNLEIAEFMIEKGAHNFDESMRALCVGDNPNIKVVEKLVEHGANNFNACLAGACIKNDRAHLVKYFISKGGNNFNDCISNHVENNRGHHQNNDVINTIMNAGLKINYNFNYESMKNADYFRPYHLYYLHTDTNIKPIDDEKYVRLIKSYPPYVFLSIWYVNKKRGRSLNSRSPMLKLPEDLVRTMYSYL